MDCYGNGKEEHFFSRGKDFWICPHPPKTKSKPTGTQLLRFLEPLDLRRELLPPRRSRGILPRDERQILDAEGSDVVGGKEGQGAGWAQEAALDDLRGDVVDEALDGDAVVRFEGVVDVVDGRCLVAEVQGGRDGAEVYGYFLPVFKPELLEAVDEAFGACGCEVVGKVVVVGEKGTVSLVVE